MMTWNLKLMTPMKLMKIQLLSLDSLQGKSLYKVSIFYFLYSKDNPLEFTYWRKMLRDVREQLKADALEK